MLPFSAAVRNFLGRTLATVTAAAVAAAGGATAAAPQWQVLPVKHAAAAGQWFRALGWASGRVWFVVGTEVPDKSSGCANCVKLAGQIWSARIQAGRLTSFVSSTVSDDVAGQSFMNGASLVLPERPTTAASLLVNGRLGAWAPIPNDPEQVASQLPGGRGAGTVQAVATVGGRTVWAIAGGTTLSACCTEAGEATDLGSLLTNRLKLNAGSVRLGVDAHQRLWLAWTERQQGPFVTLHLAQLDAGTLTSRSPRSYGPAWQSSGGGSQGDDDFTLACADTCRLVFADPTGILSWGGDGPPTRLLAQDKQRSIHVLAAASRGQGLALASFKGSTDYGWRLSLARGDSRGRRLQTVTSTDVPKATPHPNESYNAYELRAIFAPSGVVTLAAYPRSGLVVQPIRSAVLRG